MGNTSQSHNGSSSDPLENGKDGSCPAEEAAEDIQQQRQPNKEASEGTTPGEKQLDVSTTAKASLQSVNNNNTNRTPLFFILAATAKDDDKVSAMVQATLWFVSNVLRVQAFCDTHHDSNNNDNDNNDITVMMKEEETTATLASCCTHALVVVTPQYHQDAQCRQALQTLLERQKLAQEEEEEEPPCSVLAVKWGLDGGDNDTKDYPAEVQQLLSLQQQTNQSSSSTTTTTTTSIAAFLLDVIWPRLVQALKSNDDDETTCTHDVLQHALLSYIHLHHAHNSNNDNDADEQPTVLPDELIQFAQSKGVPFLLAPDDEQSLNNNEDATPSLPPNQRMLLGVAFANDNDDALLLDDDKGNDDTQQQHYHHRHRAWNSTVRAGQLQMEARLQTIMTHGHIKYGRGSLAPRRHDGLGAAVVRLSSSSSSAQQDKNHADYSLPFQSRVQTAVQALTRKLRGATREHDLERMVLCTAWQQQQQDVAEASSSSLSTTTHLLVEAPQGVLECLSKMIGKTLENDLRVTGMTPAFAIRAVLEDPLDIDNGQTAPTTNQVFLWKKAGMSVLVPMSCTALNLLSTGGIPSKQWQHDEVLWSAMVLVANHVPEPPPQTTLDNDNATTTANPVRKDSNADAIEALRILAESATVAQPDTIRTVSLESARSSDIQKFMKSVPRSALEEDEDEDEVEEQRPATKVAGGLDILAEFASEHLGPMGSSAHAKASGNGVASSSTQDSNSPLRDIQEWHIVLGNGPSNHTTRATKLLCGIKSQFKKGFYGKMAAKWTEEATTEFFERLSVIFPATPDAGKVLINEMATENGQRFHYATRYGYPGVNHASSKGEWPYFVEAENAQETLIEFLASDESPQEFVSRSQQTSGYTQTHIPEVSYIANEVTTSARSLERSNRSAQSVNSDSEDSKVGSASSIGSGALSLKRKLNDDNGTTDEGRSRRGWTGLDWMAEIAQANAASAGLSVANSNDSQSSQQQPKKSGARKKKRIRKNYDPRPEDRDYIELTDDDVGLGRGGALNRHPGNLKFHQAKLELQPRYHEAIKDERTVIAQGLVDRVHAWGGKFLKKDSHGWYVVDNHTARTKCSQALRENYTAEERAAKRQRYRQRKAADK